LTLLHRITEVGDLDEFAEAYERASGYRVSPEYLGRALVFGLRRRGRLVGGVVMTAEAPLRTLTRVPAPQRAQIAAAVGNDTVELTCVWLDPAYRSGLVSALFWYGLFLETGRRGVRHVLFGTESESLQRMYRLGRPRILYSGPVTVDGQDKHGWIFHSPVAHRWPALTRMTLYKLGLRFNLDRAESVAVPSVHSGQSRHAGAVPLRGLSVATAELRRGLVGRLRGTDRRRAGAALAAARAGGWALVTGASSGIGLAYARQLAAGGAGLLLVADDPDLPAVADRLRDDHGVPVDALVVDLAADAALDKIVGWVGDRRVEVLVNNAGLGSKGPFISIDPDDYARLIRVNLTAPVLLTRALLPAMVARGRGAVIHVASINALAPMPYSAVYSATKTFLLTYATAAWYENRDRGVVFQTLLPGTTATAFHDRQATALPGWAAAPDAVAASSLRRLGRQPVHVPGRLNRALRVLGALMPLRMRTAAAGEALLASLGTGTQSSEVTA
jgi:short-subunit dehydrogenase